jgi:hypothetical protein
MLQKPARDHVPWIAYDGRATAKAVQVRDIDEFQFVTAAWIDTQTSASFSCGFESRL